MFPLDFQVVFGVVTDEVQSGPGVTAIIRVRIVSPMGRVQCPSVRSARRKSLTECGIDAVETGLQEWHGSHVSLSSTGSYRGVAEHEHPRSGG